jgi:hypothetical protein
MSKQLLNQIKAILDPEYTPYSENKKQKIIRRKIELLKERKIEKNTKTWAKH